MDLESAGMLVKMIGFLFLIAFVIDLIVTILAIKRIREKRRKKEHEVIFMKHHIKSLKTTISILIENVVMANVY